MEEVIIIRIIDSNGSEFTSIMSALQKEQLKIADVTIIDQLMINIGEIRIHPSCCQVFVSKKEVLLNHGEYAMLYCMAKAPGRVFTREELYAAAWGEIYPYGSNSVDNTIFRLRKKIEPDPKHPIYIKTVFGIGYKINAPRQEIPEDVP